MTTSKQKLERKETLLLEKEQYVFELDCFVNALEDDLSLTEVQVRLQSVKDLFSRFIKMSQELRRIDETLMGTLEMSSFERKYFSAVTKATNLLQKYAAPVMSAEQQESKSSGALTSTWKKPKLPQFVGKYEEWPSFWQMFTALVHNNQSLQLADPTFFKESCIDIILGLNLVWNILCPNQIQHDKHLILQETRFGWIVGGTYENVVNMKSKNVLLNYTAFKNSLNDILRVGPKIQEKLFSILIRFREYPVVMTADATKMYRQVLITPEHRRFQRIIWREKESDPLSIFELNTVTYGTAPASFLAVRTLQETAKVNKNIYPAASEKILSSFYVDDFLSGGWNVTEVRELKKQVEEILAAGKSTLRKWTSNKRNIFEDQQNPNEPFYFNSSNEVKVLGVQWNCMEDMFHSKRLE